MITTSIIIRPRSLVPTTGRAVDSALRHCPADGEVILVANGTPGDARGAQASDDTRFRVVHSSEDERAEVWNAGLTAAAGEFILLLDDDDELLPNAANRLSGSLRAAPASVVAVCGVDASYAARDALTRPFPPGGRGQTDELLRRLLGGKSPPTGGALLRSSRVREVAGFRSTHFPAEDWDLLFRLAHCGEFQFIECPTVRNARKEQQLEDEPLWGAQLDYFLSPEFAALLADLRRSGRREDLRRLAEVLTAHAGTCQHKSMFEAARKLMSLVAGSGRPYPLLGREQLWRSWLPRTGLRRLANRFGYDVVPLAEGPGRDPFHDMRAQCQSPNHPVLFDVGANTGQTARKFLETFADPRVYSFEPDPQVFRTLQRATAALRNVSIHNCAIGARPGTIELQRNAYSDMSSALELGPEGWGYVWKKTPVPMRTLDQFAEERGVHNIDVLKTDTQGYDLEVLRGARRLLERGRVHMVFLEITFASIYAGLPRLDEIYAFLADQGFSLVSFYTFHYQSGRASWTDALFINPRYRPCDNDNDLCCHSDP